LKIDRNTFAHLHLHTEYSMLDGAARVGEIMAAVASDGQPAVAMTDHGVLYGAVDFYQTAKDAGVKPILGMEAYLTPGSRFDRPTGDQNVRHHITLLAYNDVGYHNLIKISSKAYLEGYWYKPRTDRLLLAEHADGIIATSGCMSGEIASHLVSGLVTEEGGSQGIFDPEAAAQTASEYQDIFGRENFFIEIMDHGLTEQQQLLPELVKVSKRVGAPLLATNDSHYVKPEESEAHDVLLCVNTGSNLADDNRLRFGSQEFYIKSAQAMRRLFPSDQYPGACDNTLVVAERVEVGMEMGKLLLPDFPTPAGHSHASYLKDLVWKGARKRYGGQVPSAVSERIRYELGVIRDMGFQTYFLIIWDLIREARERGIRVGPGRGSAAGSMVAYCLEITLIDPMEYGLIFERFLNPGRAAMPDIDIDFDERFRSQIIDYVRERYGSDHVAQIVTFATIKGKQAIRDAARVYGYEYRVGDQLAKQMPPAILGKEASLRQCLNPPSSDSDGIVRDWYANAAGLREAYNSDPDARKVIDTARGLEGLRRQDSIHAAGVVISPVPMSELVPIQQKGREAEVVTQYEMGAVEKLGLLKMDFLGLRNLSTIERTLDMVEEATGHRPDIDQVPLDDPRTFQLLRAAETIGVFQLEGEQMRVLIQRLRPDQFDDVVALVALYRPGPMGANMHTMYADRKTGRAPVQPLHPTLKDVLAPTYQILVYQEQVMEVSRAMAGYSMEEADNLRKAMGKKIQSVMDAEEEKFVEGCAAQGHDTSTGRELFGLISHFAGYGFNKSHSACYGLIAYQTAYLKANHPAEYMAALLTSSKANRDRTSMYLKECRRMGLSVKVPDVNESGMDYQVSAGSIRVGLSAIKNLGESVAQKIIEARQEKGAFISFVDFCEKVAVDALRRNTLESLVKGGGFDGLKHTRRGLVEVLPLIVDSVVDRRRREEAGQFSLFGGGGMPDLTLPEIPDRQWDKQVRLGFEKEMLGLYLSDHPLAEKTRDIEAAASEATTGLERHPDGTKVKIAGLIVKLDIRWTRKGDRMMVFTIEDLDGEVEAVAFPQVVKRHEDLLAVDRIIVLSGRVDRRDDAVQLIATRVEPLKAAPPSLDIYLSRSFVEERDNARRLGSVLRRHPGRKQVVFRIRESGTRIHTSKPKVSGDPELLAELQELLGADSVVA
jgi:DNA polymerase-3 subunit alpha